MLELKVIVLHFKLLLSIMIFAVLSCTQKPGGNMELNIHLPDVKIQIDPQKMEDAFSMMVSLQLFRGLLRYDQNGDVLADLAESWKESADRLNYTFKLKPARFSNGKTITAKNVQMTFGRLFYLGAAMGADIDYIAGVEEFKKSWDISKLGIKVVNEKEIEISLKHPSTLFLKQIAVVDCSILELEDFKQELNLSITAGFSGPYKLKNTSDEKKFSLEKWREDKLDSQRPPQVINFYVTKDSPIDLAKSGKTDSLDTDIIPLEVERELRKSGWSSRPTELTTEWFVVLNPKYIPFELREELYNQIDSLEIIKMLNESHLTPAFGLIPKGFYGYIDKKINIPRKHSTYKGKKITFKLDYVETSEFEKKIAFYLKNKWTSKNVEVIPNGLSRGDRLTRMFTKVAEATIGKKGTDYPDGYSILTYFKGKYEANYFHVDDPHIDQIIGKASQESNKEIRAQLYKDIQSEIIKHYTCVPLLFGTLASGLWSDKVESIPSHPLGYHTMPYETILMRSM